MASIYTCFFAATNKYKFNSHSTTIYVKPSLRFHSIRLPTSLHFNYGLKLRRINRRSAALIRASADIAISAIRPGAVIESDKLPSDLRKLAINAIDSFGGRVTVGDLASKAGLKLNEAQKSLQALAADTDGFLEVSDEGDVLYVFPKDYRLKLTAKSFRLKIEPLIEKTKLGAEYLVRASFGTVLIASIVIVFTAFIVLILSSSSKDKNRRSSNSFTSRSSSRKPQMRDDRKPQMGDDKFIESVFFFVFGDGDPNKGIEEERWKLIGEYIASNGGVVTAEEIAPYLDVEETADKMDDDSYILPVLLRFEGQPEIDEEGNILYRFPSFQRTATPGRWTDLAGGLKFFKEKKWSFSKASSSQLGNVIILGCLNLFGLIVVGTMMKGSMTTKSNGFISFVSRIFPLLQIYAGSFFTIPLVRWFFNQRTNAEIEKRNKARELRSQALELPDLSLRKKLSSARDMAQRTYIGEDRIVYSTEKDFSEQDYDTREWDQRLPEIEKTCHLEDCLQG